MLSGICFKQIKDNFWLGQYEDFQVIMMEDCSYVNASKLCKDGGKRFDHWLENAASKRLIKALEEQLGHEAFDFTPVEASLTEEDAASGLSGGVCKYIQTANITQEDKLISGTYIHALLIPHVACWISEVFALKVSEIVNKHMLSDNTRKLEEAEQQRLLAETECSTAKRARIEADVKLNKAEHARLDAIS